MASSVRPDGKRALRVLRGLSLDDIGAETRPAGTAGDMERWVPSRFNVRARDQNGHLVLWNTLSNSISAFDPEQAEDVLPMLSRYGFDAPNQGMIEYLVKRGFLVRSGTDEYRQFQRAFRRQHHRPERLELVLLASQPASCDADSEPEHAGRLAMRPEVRQGLRRMLEQRIPDLQALDVSWLGVDHASGWAVLEELGPIVAALAEDHGVTYTARVNIGAPQLTPEVVDRLLACRIPVFQVTPDSIPDGDDAVSEATCATILENFTSMSLRGDRFRVFVHLDHERNNGDDIEPCLERLQAALGDDPRFELRFHAARRRPDRAPRAQDAPPLCGVDEQHALVARLEAAARAHGLRFGMLKHVSQMGGQVCHAARPYSFVVGARGQLMKCTLALDSAAHNQVGHLDADGHMHLDPERLARWTEPAFERDSLCQRCVVLPNCQGMSCPLVRLETGERHCAPTRATGKRKLRELLQLGREQARRKTIDTAIPDTGTN